MARRKTNVIIWSIVIMALFQILLGFIKYICNTTIKDDLFDQQMLTMSVLIFLTLIVILLAKKFKVSLSIMPESFNKWYILATIIVVLLYVSTPSLYTDGLPALLTLIYGSIITSIYEELLFRGLIWNKCKNSLRNETKVYIWNIIFFTLWDLCYMIPNMIAGDWTAVIWKAVAGLCYGVVLGFVRLKTKNCYATILLHGILNLFMI